jgi:UDP-N-acetylglucosamine/UDP-N-acetylgalactosamine diphosphorylase
MSDRISSIRSTLDQFDQSHLLTYVDELSPPQREALLEQLEAIDFDAMRELIARHSAAGGDGAVDHNMAPAPYYPADPSDPVRPWDSARYEALGEELIRAGKIAAFTVAGGQGTRLGWNGPKGTFPATPLTGKPLFQCFAEQILAARRKYDVEIPWYIMTSPLNDADTRAFLANHNYFGLTAQDIIIFPQGTIPSFDPASGKLLLADKGEVAVNPDGHGGSLKALRASGALEDMARRGVEHVSYFQVDNPLVKAIDPLFIGLHAHADDSSAEISSKMVAKTYPAEKVGVFCRVDGKTVVVEYSDLPEELADQRTEDGRLRFNAGSIAIHIFSVPFIERLTDGDSAFALPYHRAMKKASYVDVQTGDLVEPTKPNVVKLEMFVFDALMFAESSTVLQTPRAEEFAPIKNADGVDSPATSFQLQTERAAAWLEAQGVSVPRDDAGQVSAIIEISPLTALGPADLDGQELPASIEPGAELAL